MFNFDSVSVGSPVVKNELLGSRLCAGWGCQTATSRRYYDTNVRRHIERTLDVSII